MPDGPVTDVRLQWKGGMRFDAYNSVTVNAPDKAGDPFEGFKPGEMLMASLAGCSGIDIIGILQKQRQAVTSIEINIRGTQNPEAPWPYEEIELEYVVRGKGLKESAVERAIHLSETKYCSITATLSKDTNVTSTYRKPPP